MRSTPRRSHWVSCSLISSTASIEPNGRYGPWYAATFTRCSVPPDGGAGGLGPMAASASAHAVGICSISIIRPCVSFGRESRSISSCLDSSRRWGGHGPSVAWSVVSERRPFPEPQVYDHGLLDVGEGNLVYWEARGQTSWSAGPGRARWTWIRQTTARPQGVRPGGISGRAVRPTWLREQHASRQ